MSSWNVRVEPAPCVGLGRLAEVLHLGAALAPWAAGCTPPLAAILSAACLVTLPATLAALPGRRCAVRALARLDGAWSAVLSDGRDVAIEVDRATRVFAGLVVCRLAVGNRRYDCWLPRYAVPAGDFRRLKVALRCIRRGEPGSSC
jgi:hypothetical protein